MDDPKRKNLENDIDKLKAESSEIIKKKLEIKIEIKKLEIDQKSSQKMLTKEETFKKKLEEIDKKFIIYKLIIDFTIKT
ncbi:hypothetical protein [Candidatus Phytoplasma prunorum]|uniref:hypothetical protein n=1 Tax=Candidatus Phytoplasma prunorum TaxID=47565 RepID=UPI002FEED08E